MKLILQKILIKKFNNEEDAKLGKVELINVKSLTKLIKLIDKTKESNIYKELCLKAII